MDLAPIREERKHSAWNFIKLYMNCQICQQFQQRFCHFCFKTKKSMHAHFWWKPKNNSWEFLLILRIFMQMMICCIRIFNKKLNINKMKICPFPYQCCTCSAKILQFDEISTSFDVIMWTMFSIEKKYSTSKPKTCGHFSFIWMVSAEFSEFTDKNKSKGFNWVTSHVASVHLKPPNKQVTGKNCMNILQGRKEPTLVTFC